MVGDAGDQPLQLWQFIMVLLNDPANKHIIAWTGRGRSRFKLVNPDEVSSINLLSVSLSFKFVHLFFFFAFIYFLSLFSVSGRMIE